MQRPTMSIRTMLAIVAFIALACVALARANSAWASVMFTAALAVILFAIVAVIFRRGAKQAYWIGFALFGWGYLWMAHWPGEFATTDASLFSWRMQNDSNGTLATTQLVVHAYNKWLPLVRKPPEPPVQPATPTVGYGAPGGGGGSGYGATSGSRRRVRYGVGYGTSSGPVPAGDDSAPGLPPVAASVASYPAMHEFTRVGHSLLTIILAFIGGVVAAVLYNTRARGLSDKSEPATKSGSTPV